MILSLHSTLGFCAQRGAASQRAQGAYSTVEGVELDELRTLLRRSR